MLRQLLACYAAGSLGAVAALGAFWALAKFTSSWSFLIQPSLADFYQPAVWGGLCGLLFLLPLRMRWYYKGPLLALVPAIIQLFQAAGWFSTEALAQVDANFFLEQRSLVTIGLYMLFWGLGGQYVLTKS